MKTIFLLLIACTTPFFVYGQTYGPGGVGTNSQLWFKADAIDQANGSPVSNWRDMSGNAGRDAINTVANEPTFITNQVNGWPVVSFDGGDALTVTNSATMPGLDLTPGTDDFTFFTVYQADDGEKGYFLSKAGSNSGERQYGWYLFDDNTLNSYIGGTRYNSGITGTGVGSKIVSSVVTGLNDQVSFYLDGGNLSQGAIGTTLPAIKADVLIGARRGDNNNESSGYGLTGQIAEIAFYDKALNDAERIVVENHLSTKYGIGIATANDFYEEILAPGHKTDLIGIGQDASGDKHAASENGGGALSLAINSGFGNGEYLFAAHDNNPHSLTLNGISGSFGRWGRTWYLDVTETDGITVDLTLSLLDAGFSAAKVGADYHLLKYNTVSSEWEIVAGTTQTAVGGETDFTFTVTLSNTDDGLYTLGVPEFQTWYSYKSGDWDDPDTWTLDPGASPSYDNPLSLTPTTSPTAANDQVVIKSGYTITVDAASINKVNSALEVNGTLDLSTSTGHNFGLISGNGTIRLAADNFPEGNPTHFVTRGQGEGTVIYYGDDITLNTAREFFNMQLEMNAGQTVTLLADYQVNGELRVETGTLKFNDDDINATRILNCSVYGDFVVEAAGTVSVGTATNQAGDGYLTPEDHPFHQLTLEGNFRNYGTVNFTNWDEAADVGSYYTEYPSAAGKTGIVEVTFANDFKDQLLQANGVTNFYRIICDKGSDETYMVDIRASAADNFGLLGRTDRNYSGDVPNIVTDNALAIPSGTVRLGDNIVIPHFAYKGFEYSLDSDARLWIDGGSVTVPGEWLRVAGILQVSSDGILSIPYGSDGISIRETGQLLFEDNCDVDVSIIKTSRGGGGSGDHIGSYTQTGGNVTIRPIEDPDTGNIPNTAWPYFRFTLPYPENAFIMSGGTLHVKYPRSGKDGGFLVAADAGNISVTGGTVILETDDEWTDFNINSTAPFYDLILRNTVTGTQQFVLDEYTNDGSAQPATGDIPAQDLVVLNDLTIETGTTRTSGGDTYGTYLDLCPDGNCVDLTVGGDLTIEDNAVLDLFSGNPDNAGSSSVTFNGSQDATFYVGDITNYQRSLTGYDDPENEEVYERWEHPFYNFYVDKPNATLFFAAKDPSVQTSGVFKTTGGGKNLYEWRNNIIKVLNEFELTANSTINQIDQTDNTLGYSIRLYGSNIINSGILTVFEEGVTPKNYQMKTRVGGGDITIKSTPEAEIGNLRLNSGADILSTTSDFYIKRLEYRHGRIDISTHNLKVDVFDYNLAGGQTRTVNGNHIFSMEDMIIMAGNASDGGLSIKAQKNTDTGYPQFEGNDVIEYNSDDWIWFPIGTNANATSRYTPAICYIKTPGTYTGDEYITVRVVDSELQTTDLTGGDILSYYWNVDFEGFESGEEPQVSWLFQYDESDKDAYDEALFVPGKVLDGGTYQRSDDGDELAVRNGGTTGDNGDVLGDDPRNIIIFNGIGTSDVPVLTDDIDGINDPDSRIFNNGPAIDNLWKPALSDDPSGFTLENANYTAGVAARFVGEPSIYRTKIDDADNNRSWNANNTWDVSTDGGTTFVDAGNGDYPDAGDIAIIADGDEVQVDDFSVAAAEVIIDGTIYNVDDGGRSKLVFRDANGAGYNSTFGKVSAIATDIGNGQTFGTLEFYIDGTWAGNLPSGDYGDFANYANANGEYFEWTYNYAHQGTGVTTGLVDLPVEISSYPQLRFQIQGDDLNNSQNPNGDKVFQFPDIDITVNDLMRTQDGIIVRLSDVGGSLTLNDELVFDNFDENSRLQFPGNTITPTTLTVKGNITFEGDGTNNNRKQWIEVYPTDGSTVTHNLVAEGDIDLRQGGILDLNSGGNANVVLEAGGESGTNQLYTSTGGLVTLPDLYRVRMNKGTDTTSTFTINTDVVFPLPSDISTQPIEIVNGLLILNDPDITVTLTDASTGDFQIPNLSNPEASSGSGGLHINQGHAIIKGDDTGIILDGLLRVGGHDTQNGTLDMAYSLDAGNNGNNFIEYSSSGNAVIEIEEFGQLYVGSQIRRSLLNSSGVLKYRQSGGFALIGYPAYPDHMEDTRGVFEVINAGSEFTFTGGFFNLINGNGSTTVPSLRLSPDTYTVGDGTNIYIGAEYSVQGDNMGIYSDIALDELTIAEGQNGEVASDIDMTASIFGVPLTVNVLRIGGNDNVATFDANGYNLTINEELINQSGEFVSSGNSTNNQTTFFPSASTVHIGGGAGGTTNFWNLTKTGSNILSIEKDITVLHDATFNGGTVNTNTSYCYLKGNLFHDALHTNDAAGWGIYMNGSLNQTIQRTVPSISESDLSYLGTLTIDNAEGVTIQEGDFFQINDRLNLVDGILEIGGNLLIIGDEAHIDNDNDDATVVSVNTFGSTRFIQTNSSIRDKGLEKVFLGTESMCIFPVGQSKYTPVELNNITSLTAGAKIRIRPVNTLHPSIIDDTETQAQIVDADNALQYYWVVKASGHSAFTAEARFYYDNNDVQFVGGSLAGYDGDADGFGPNIDNYGPARLLAASTSWNKLNKDYFLSTSKGDADNYFYYTLTNANNDNITGAYTAGVIDNGNGIILSIGDGDGAIPANVPEYQSNVADMDYDTDGSWLLVGSAPALTSGMGPQGAIIRVMAGKDVTINTDNKILVRTYIEEGATLTLAPGSDKHSLGTVYGPGNIKLQADASNPYVFPNGNYDDFLSCTGGGIEYAGSGDHDVLSGITALRSLVLSGSGVRQLPNNSVLVCDDVDIQGTTQLVNAPDESIYIRGDLTMAATASIDAGRGSSAKITLDGTEDQTVTGDFTNGSELNILEIDKAAGKVILGGTGTTVEVDDQGELRLTSGIVESGEDNLVKVSAGTDVIPAGGSSASFVDGYFDIYLDGTANSFTFPIGDGTNYQPMLITGATNTGIDWTGIYRNQDPATFAGLNEDISLTTPIVEIISDTEFWELNGSPGDPSAYVTIGWNANSNIDPNANVSDLHFMHWEFVEANKWGYRGHNRTGNITTGTVTTSNAVNFSTQYFTIGASDMILLPVQFLSLEAFEVDEGVMLEWKTIQEFNNSHFLVERAGDGRNWEVIGSIDAEGGYNEVNHYQYVDEQPLSGKNYYRLKQVDHNGSFEYTKVVVVTLETPQHFSLIVYPNPVDKGQFHLSISGLASTSKLSIALMDLWGKAVLSKQTVTDAQGSLLLPCAVPRTLPTGIYILRVNDGKNLFNQKILIR